MKIAPLQLVKLSFRRVHVEVDPDHMEAVQKEGIDAHDLFEGVLIKTEVSRTQLEREDPRGTPYFVTLRVSIDNTPSEDDSQRVFTPYLVDIEAGGVVVLAERARVLGDPDDLIAVNGSALLWSAIREQVATLTARMPLGQAMLPSVNFHDLKKAQPAAAVPISGAAATPPVTKRKRVSKAAASQP